jgi:hypothetical protein
MRGKATAPTTYASWARAVSQTGSKAASCEGCRTSDQRTEPTKPTEPAFGAIGLWVTRVRVALASKGEPVLRGATCQ